MIEQQFWSLIELASDSDEFYGKLKRDLYALGAVEIISFKTIFMKKLVDSYTFPLLAANFVISSYVSDDGFRGFRAWLISQGSTKYFDGVSNPETIAEWLDKNDVDDIDGDLILNVADVAYEELGGDASELMQKVKSYPDPEIKMDWPENKSEFEKKYPKLVKKFWDQARIKDLHS